MSEIDKVVRALVSSLEAPPYPAGRSELSPILTVLTVLLAMDKRKPGWVEERVKRLNSPDPGYGTLAGARDYARLLTPEKYFAMELGDDKGKRAGLLLPLLDGLIDSLRDFPAATEAEQARAWATAARPSDWSFGPFRGLGLRGFQHLRILLGANSVFPRKEIIDFVCRAIDRKVDSVEAIFLVERAADRLRYGLREVTDSVWALKTSEGQKGGG